MRSPKADHELGKIKPGDKHNYLTAASYHGTQIDTRGHKSPLWVFLCECGNEVVAGVNTIKQGRKKSCGCMNPKRARRHNKPEMPDVKRVTQKHFQLADGRMFEHLFEWSYVPDVDDFKKLIAHCPEIMDDLYLIRTITERNPLPMT